MVKVNIISGFLGAGKTTLIKKLLGGAMKDEQVILLENEYGEVGIDGGFMKDSGITVTEMNSGCICCTLVGDFTKAIDELIEKYHPDRLIIEPSGVGKLSDIRHVVAQAEKKHELVLSGCVTVVDAGKCKMYMKNFGEFFCDQVRSAETIILSRTQMTSQDKIDADIAMLREQNPAARIITTPWDDLTADVILKTIESPEALINVDEIYEEHHHDDDEDEHEHHHHHHHDGEECDDPHCGCHHHHHHADEVFTSWGIQTVHRFNRSELEDILKMFSMTDEFGEILRAKGIVESDDGQWIEFDIVPEETEIRNCEPDYTGRICVIGTELNTEYLSEVLGK